MAVDLRSNSFLSRVSYLVDADCLIKLEHGYSKDRMKKVGFDRVEQMVVWRQLPGVRIALCGLCMLLGLFLMIPGEVLRVMGVILLLLSGAGMAYFLYCGKTTIRLVRAGRAEDLTGVFWPGKVTWVVAQLSANIKATQARGFAQLAEKEAARAEASGVTGTVPPDGVDAGGRDLGADGGGKDAEGMG